MATTHALVIGVENYQSNKLRRVAYAEKDATAVCDALIATGCPEANAELILSDKATKTTLEYYLKTFARSAGQEDTLYIFYAGHGLFSDGKNYLTATDTRLDDAAGTCISLDQVLEEFKQSPCQRIILFLDACHSGLEIASNLRGVTDHMSSEELESFFSNSQFRICFAACRSDEKAHSSYQLQHGIWTYFLVQALSGDAPDAISNGTLLKGTELQSYLAQHVPQLVKRENGTTARQTPHCFGTFSQDFLVADLSGIMAARDVALKLDFNGIRDVHFIGTPSGGSVRNLRGFKKGIHKIPEAVNEHTEKFLSQVCDQELEELAEGLFQSFTKCFDYKIDDDVKRYVDSPTASVVTPDFTLDLSYQLDEDAPSHYIVRYDLNSISNPSVLFDEKFNAILGGTFDALTISFKEKQDLRDFVRAVEKDGRVQITRPSNLSYCKVTIPGRNEQLLVRPRSLTISFASGVAPGLLVESFKSMAESLPSGSPMQSLLQSVSG